MKTQFESVPDRRSYLPACAARVRSLLSCGERTLNRILDRMRLRQMFSDKDQLLEIGLLLLIPLALPIAFFIAVVLLAWIW
ncbi:hypothetical protein ACVDG5_021405 [Mesorhizobium sp. ORM6]